MMPGKSISIARLRWVALASAVALVGLLAWSLHGARDGRGPATPDKTLAPPSPAAEATAGDAVPTAAGPVRAASRGAPLAAKHAGHAGKIARSGASADAARPGGPLQAARANPTPGMSAGMIAAVDPKTGKLVEPTPEQIRALTSPAGSTVSRSAEGLVEVHRPDGSVMIDLQGRFQDYAVARIGPDGKPVISCVPDSAAALRALRDSVVPPPSPEEK